MSESLTSEEVAILIRARQIQREKGLPANVNVSEICEVAGISRKTGYEWVEKSIETSLKKQKELEEELDRLKAEHEKLQADLDQVSFENEGRKLAWEIHGVDKWLASKKNTSFRKKRQKL
jgi:transposase